ncbi:MAG: 50S ribosomal protein L10 [Chlamydiae bacterium]|nr:50S ribosomal protein L10 [Chlamydiota bacterium]
MRSEKQLLLDEVKEKLSSAKALIFTQNIGLNPNLSYNLRCKLAETGGGYSVVHKRVFLKAAAEQGIVLEKDQLQGHIALVYAMEDSIETTKALYGFAKENKGFIEILAGYFDGRVCGPSDVTAISKLPSQDEMRAQLLGLFEAPMSQTLSVMESLLTSVIHCLENKSKL